MKHITVSQLNAAWAAIGDHMADYTRQIQTLATKLARQKEAVKQTEDLMIALNKLQTGK